MLSLLPFLYINVMIQLLNREVVLLLYKLLRCILRLLFSILYRVSVIGTIELSDNIGYMICSNHIHMFDPVFIACFTNRQISFMGKKELFDKPIIGSILKKLGAFPVDRGKGDIEALKTAIDVLKSNNVMSMFPEGTRSKTGEMGEFKRGAALIASRAEVPIVPVKIIGNYRLFSKMELRIGEPMYPTKENKKTLIEELYNNIKKL